MRVALVCSGLGYVNRGFERIARDLFDTYPSDAGVLLVKGGGPGSVNELSLRVPRRTGVLRELGVEQAYRIELAAFATRLLPHLMRRRIQVVHYLEPYLGNVLAAARRALPLDYTLLLTDALGLTARSSRHADVLHVLTPLAETDALRDGRPREQVYTIPAGIHVAEFGKDSRAAARADLGLPDDARVVLDVAALNRRHKHVDTLIDEVARLEDDTVLMVAGSPEEPDLVEYGDAKLGGRFHHAHMARERMPTLYAAADVFAHAAFEEGFGLAPLEAMASGLPVVMHDSPHFRWLVGDERQLVDFREPGALARGLDRSPDDARGRNRQRAQELDWSNLAPHYLEMYERVIAGRA